METKEKFRWFHPTPGRLLALLLVVETSLFIFRSWLPKGWAVLIAVATVGLFLLFMLLWFIAALVFHRRFQFSIWSLLVLTVAVAIPSSWLTAEMKWAREQKEAAEFLMREVGDGRTYGPNTTSKTMAWLETLLGRDFFKSATVFIGRKPTDDDLKHLKKGVKITLFLPTQVTDAELEKLQDTFPNVVFKRALY